MPAQAPIPTITCPNCKQTLTAKAQVCQFCKADVRSVARPIVPNAQAAPIADSNWKVVAYYAMGIYWIVNGLLIIIGSAIIQNKLIAGGAGMFAGIPAIGIVIGLVFALTGAGMLLRVELARGIVNILSWLTIVMSVLRVVGLLLAGFFMGPIVILMIFRSVVDGLFAGFQIYLIGETDNYM